jgi:hypothetical protein
VGVEIVEDDVNGRAISFMKSRCAAGASCARRVTSPVATSKAANKVLVPLRRELEIALCSLQRLDRGLRTQMTMAFSAGAM